MNLTLHSYMYKEQNNSYSIFNYKKLQLQKKKKIIKKLFAPISEITIITKLLITKKHE